MSSVWRRRNSSRGTWRNCSATAETAWWSWRPWWPSRSRPNFGNGPSSGSPPGCTCGTSLWFRTGSGECSGRRVERIGRRDAAWASRWNIPYRMHDVLPNGLLEILGRRRQRTRGTCDRQIPGDPFFQDDAGVEGFGRIDPGTGEGGPADEHRTDRGGGRRQIDDGRDCGAPARLSVVYHDVSTFDFVCPTGGPFRFHAQCFRAPDRMHEGRRFRKCLKKRTTERHV